MRWLLRPILVLSLLLSTNMPLSGSGSSSSGSQAPKAPEPWQSYGPYGASVRSLAIHPTNDNIVFAGTMGAGVYSTTDGGVTWTQLLNGLGPQINVYGLTFAPEDPQTVYAASYGGVFKSTDSGLHWARTSGSSFGSQDLWTIVAAPTLPTTLYVGTYLSGIYASSDGGNTWVTRNNGLEGTNVTAIAFHPITPTLMLAATYDTSNFGRVWKSNDGGANWSPTTAIPGTSAPIMALAFSPASSDIIYVGEGNGKGNPPTSTTGKTFRSINGGLDWQVVNFQGSNSGESWSIIFADASTIYLGTRFSAGLWRSTDGGGTWQNYVIPSAGFANWLCSLVLGSGGTLYAGTQGPGVFRTATGGSLNWQRYSNGLTGIIPNEVAADPANPAYAYAITDGAGLFRTSDGGQSWQMMTVGSWSYGLTVVVAPAPITNTAYIGLPYSVAYTTDGGDHWSISDITHVGNPEVTSIVVHPITPTILYTGIQETTTRTGSVWKYDGLWQTLPITASGAISSVLSLAYVPNDILLAGTRGAGVYRSVDGGQTWNPSNSGLINLTVNHLVYANGAVWAALNGGVTVSFDNGQTWENRSNGLSGHLVRRIAADPLAGSVLYAAADNGFYSTTNTGQSWVIDAGPLAGVYTRSVSAVAEGGATRMYVATIGGVSASGSSSRTQSSNYTPAGVYQKVVQWHWLYLPVVQK